MLKSPEEYLSQLSFDPPVSNNRSLTSGEKIFIEKYLGLDAFERIPEIIPEDSILISPEPAEQTEITAAPVITPEVVAAPARKPVPVPEMAFQEQPETVPPPLPVAEMPPAPILFVEGEPLSTAAVSEEHGDQSTEISGLSQDQPESVEVVEAEPISVEETAQEGLQSDIREDVAQEAISTEQITESPPTANVTTAELPAEVPPANLKEFETETASSLRERLRDEAEIQMVSFIIGGQLFLLPVIAIQEVLRHQELIKVPQAPDFVAGVINLRGHVTPLVHLSALLTNEATQEYSERNFIIVCGTEQLRIGLIIDRINSMHLLPQEKIIWNAEAKLGESAEFLYAIANLDEKVCGIVAPENIAQKILSA